MSESSDLLWHIAKNGTPEEKKDLSNKLLKERDKRLKEPIKEICDELAKRGVLD